MTSPPITATSLQGNLFLQQGDFTLDSGEFSFPARGVTAIFGHSGSGKTTFLRCLAGLETGATGKVLFGSQAWLQKGKSLPVHKRSLGYVFQEASLFPHLNVKRNLLYGLRRVTSKPITSKHNHIEFSQVIEWLELTKLLQRSTANLSGGERQRVAIGRTLLSQPKVLMMDEPLASLDLFAKQAIMPYLERLRDELDIPILYVSHSPEEVSRLADTVVFMQQGKIISIETIEEALNREGTPLYQELEPRSVLVAKIVSHSEEDGLSLVQAGDAQLWIARLPEKIGSNVRVVIVAHNVSLMLAEPKLSEPTQTTVLNHLAVTIETIEEFNQSSCLLRLRVKNEPWPLLAKITKRSINNLNLTVRQEVIAAIKSAAILS